MTGHTCLHLLLHDALLSPPPWHLCRELLVLLHKDAALVGFSSGNAGYRGMEGKADMAGFWWMLSSMWTASPYEWTDPVSRILKPKHIWKTHFFFFFFLVSYLEVKLDLRLFTILCDYFYICCRTRNGFGGLRHSSPYCCSLLYMHKMIPQMGKLFHRRGGKC
jgi:hypothetical protein